MEYTRTRETVINYKEHEKNNGFLVLVSTLYVFFSYMQFISSAVNVNMAFLATLACTLWFLYIRNLPSVRIRLLDLPWIMYAFLLLFNMATTPYRIEGQRYFFFFVMMVMLLIFLRSTTKWEKYFTRVLFLFSGIHALFIIVQALFPNVVMQINKVILTDYSYSIVEQSLSNNYFTGITNQAAAAGMFATVFCALTFCKLLTTEKKSAKLIVALLVGFVALLLTQKRSFFIASVIAIYFVLLIYNDKETRKRIMRLIRYSLLVAVGGSLILILFPKTQNVLQRFFREDSIFSSREDMYIIMRQWFDNHWLWGEGIGAAQTTFGYGGHNIYLQILAETGVVGFVFFYLALFSLVIFNIKKSRSFIKTNQTNREAHGILLFSLYMQAVFLIYGVSGNPIFDYTFFTLFIFVLAIPSAVIRNK